jgi:hypothetical protein
MIVEPTQTEARAVERAGRYLARELPQVLEDFGGIPPRLVPAVVLSMLDQSLPDLLSMQDADEWPGSLTDNRRQMLAGLRTLLAERQP